MDRCYAAAVYVFTNRMGMSVEKVDIQCNIACMKQYTGGKGGQLFFFEFTAQNKSYWMSASDVIAFHWWRFLKGEVPGKKSMKFVWQEEGSSMKVDFKTITHNAIKYIISGNSNQSYLLDKVGIFSKVEAKMNEYHKENNSDFCVCSYDLPMTLRGDERTHTPEPAQAEDELDSASSGQNPLVIEEIDGDLFVEKDGGSTDPTGDSQGSDKSESQGPSGDFGEGSPIEQDGYSTKEGGTPARSQSLFTELLNNLTPPATTVQSTELTPTTKAILSGSELSSPQIRQLDNMFEEAFNTGSLI